MSTDNVTPIRPPGDPPKPPEKRARKPRQPKPGLVLAESEEWEGFTTYDVLAGLDGITRTLDGMQWSGDMDISRTHDLAIAAKVLSQILRARA